VLNQGACSVYSEDIDGDGDMDVLGAANDDDEIAWWENLGGSEIRWTKHIIDAAFNGAQCVYSEDVDDDGDMDVLGAASHVSGIAWWENVDGSGTSWFRHDLSDNFPVVYSICSGDLDTDGDMDVLGAAYFNAIAWWEFTGDYWFYGSLNSSILDTETEPLWGYFDWDATTPANTSVSFRVRASDNYTNMGIWSEILTSPCALTDILNDGDRYLQYRAILCTSDPCATSILNDITITWNSLGVEGDPRVNEYLLLGADRNPSSGSVSIGFAVPKLSTIELSIYDLTGHLVFTPVHGEYSMGVHHIQLVELTAGIYFCLMRAGDFTSIQRFTVID